MDSLQQVEKIVEDEHLVVVEEEENINCKENTSETFTPKNVINRLNSKVHDDIEFPPRDEHETNEDPGALMIGVEIFEESDLDTDAETNKLQLYSDMDAAVDSSDARIESATSSGGLTRGSLKGPVKVKRKTVKVLREPSRLSLEERIKCIRMCSRYNSYADAQKAWRQVYDTEPPCRKTLSTLDKKFQKTGSVADLKRNGRPKTTRTEAVIARVEEAVSKDPNKSIRALARELNINQASVHRIKKEFEDKRNTLKMENKKLRDKLNEALKRIVLLEKRLTHNQTGNFTESAPGAVLPVAIEQPKYETLVISAPEGSGSASFASFTSDHVVDGHGGSNLPTIIALNNSNNQVLRLPPGQETIHIITLPQNSSHQHQVLSLDDSSSFQLSIPSTSPSGHIKSNSAIAAASFLTSSSGNQETATSSYVSFK